MKVPFMRDGRLDRNEVRQLLGEGWVRVPTNDLPGRPIIALNRNEPEGFKQKIRIYPDAGDVFLRVGMMVATFQIGAVSAHQIARVYHAMMERGPSPKDVADEIARRLGICMLAGMHKETQESVFFGTYRAVKVTLHYRGEMVVSLSCKGREVTIDASKEDRNWRDIKILADALSEAQEAEILSDWRPMIASGAARKIVCSLAGVKSDD